MSINQISTHKQLILTLNSFIKTNYTNRGWIGNVNVATVNIQFLGTAIYKHSSRPIVSYYSPLENYVLIHDYVDNILDPKEEELNYLKLVFSEELMKLYELVLEKLWLNL